MAGSRFTSAGTLFLCKGLSVGSCLTKIDLNDNNLNEEGGLALAEVLKKQKGLRHLILEACMMGEVASGAVAMAVAQSCPDLETLNLSCNDIMREGAPVIAKAVSAMKKLSNLRLSENEMGDQGIAMVCLALKHSGSPLTDFDVSLNELQRAGAVAAARLAVSKPQFAALNLDGNFISEEGVEEISGMLSEAGLMHALLPLDENDPDGEPTEEADASGLDAMLDNLKI